MHVGREREELPGAGSAKSLTWEWAWQQKDSVEGPTSAERASLGHTLSISTGRTEDIYTIDIKNALK